jgi:hypothetical protein
MSTVRIQVRRGVAADWTSVNPILAAGEMGVETDTNKFKFGNGTGAWSTLPYAASDSQAIGEISQDAINAALTMGSGLSKTYNDGANTITINVDTDVVATKTYVDNAISGLSNTADSTYVPSADKGAAYGVASLDADAHVVADQISNASVRGKLSAGTGITYDSSTGQIGVGTSIATRTYVDSSLQNLVNGAPQALDTINELATAIANDANYATTISSALATKATIDSPTFTGTVTIPEGASVVGYVKTTDLEADYINADQIDSNYLAKSDATSTYLAINNADERIQDTAAGMIQVTSGNGLGRVYDDAAGSLTLSVDHTIIDTVTARDSAITTALETAAEDATTKADGAVTTAAADATTKANTAKSEAITAAGTAADSKVSTHNSATTNVHGIADTSALVTKTYVDNADSTLQTNINAKAPIASPTFTGTVSGITKSMVGLGNVDNTADSAKPVSTATQTALDLKANLAGPTFTGTVVLPSTTSIGNVSATELGYIDGVTSAIQTQLDAKAPLASPTFTGTLTVPNLTVTGTTTTVNATNLEITDPLIYMATGNSANASDIGLVGHFNNGTYQHTGLIRDHADGKWKLFSGVTTEPGSSTVDLTGATYDTFKAGAIEVSSATIGSTTNTELGYVHGVTSAIQTQLDAKSPIASPTFTGTVTVSSSGVAFTDGTQTKEGVPSRTTITQKTADYTLSALSERDSMIEMNSASATTLTVAPSSSVNYPVGTSIDILRVGAGAVTVAAGSGVTINATPGLKLRAQWSSATLVKRATDTWVLLGDLSA